MQTNAVNNYARFYYQNLSSINVFPELSQGSKIFFIQPTKKEFQKVISMVAELVAMVNFVHFIWCDGYSATNIIYAVQLP